MVEIKPGVDERHFDLGGSLRNKPSLPRAHCLISESLSIPVRIVRLGDFGRRLPVLVESVWNRELDITTAVVELQGLGDGHGMCEVEDEEQTCTVVNRGVLPGDRICDRLFGRPWLELHQYAIRNGPDWPCGGGLLDLDGRDGRLQQKALASVHSDLSVRIELRLDKRGSPLSHRKDSAFLQRDEFQSRLLAAWQLHRLRPAADKRRNPGTDEPNLRYSTRSYRQDGDEFYAAAIEGKVECARPRIYHKYALGVWIVRVLPVDDFRSARVESECSNSCAFS